jgi:hypothetical protein
MNHFFLLNEAVNIEYSHFLLGMAELTAIDQNESDSFLKHNSIYQLAVIENLYMNYSGQNEQAISKFIEQLKPTLVYFKDEETFDRANPIGGNGFLGIDFSKTTIDSTKWVRNQDEYQSFRSSKLWEITPNTFWDRRDQLFPNLVLCGEVAGQIAGLGSSTVFNQICDRLREFDKAVKIWSDGAFSYKDINRNFALRISPESNKTMSKFKNERTFSLPDGSRKVFELHIKTGHLRFHFYPDEATKKVYVGYIGPHLPISSD